MVINFTNSVKMDSFDVSSVILQRKVTIIVGLFSKLKGPTKSSYLRFHQDTKSLYRLLRKIIVQHFFKPTIHQRRETLLTVSDQISQSFSIEQGSGWQA